MWVNFLTWVLWIVAQRKGLRFSLALSHPSPSSYVRCEETGIKIETDIIYEVHQEFTTAQCPFRAASGKEESRKIPDQAIKIIKITYASLRPLGHSPQPLSQGSLMLCGRVSYSSSSFSSSEIDSKSLVGTDFMTSSLNVCRCNESKFFITRR